jgi:uncharacterized RDD family membrane protein YckC
VDWYYTRDDEQNGPVSEGEFQEFVELGVITSETLVWCQEMPEWERYGNVQARQAGVAVSEGDSYCVECGVQFSTAELLSYGEHLVCATCKPVFFQRVREGAPIPTALNYAGFWIRFAAKFIDGIILGIVNLVIQRVGFAFMPAMDATDGGPPVFFTAMWILLVLSQYAVAIGYTTWFVGKYAATPGKMACRLKIVSPDGGQISYLKAFARYFAELLSGLILGIGYIMVAFDDEKRALHDRICETRVVYK